VNAADYSRDVAPGAIIAIFGSNLAPSTAPASAFPLPQSLGGASVELMPSGAQLPLFYASPGQINAQLPYDVPIGQLQLRVRTAAGVSNPDTLLVSRNAPKLFTIDFSGKGHAVAVTANFDLITDKKPSRAADYITLYLNSAGPVSGAILAGRPAPGIDPASELSRLNDAVTVKVNNMDAQVLFAGLVPGYTGLYQINVRIPFVVLTGAMDLSVQVGSTTSQAKVDIPYRQLGFYFGILGGKSVPNQSLNGAAGTNSALALRQSDSVTWGVEGLNAWSKNTGLGTNYASVSGLALTVRNGNTVVYDNNGLEDGSYGKFYDNTSGPDNSQKPGLGKAFTMSNYFPLLFGSYVRLPQRTTITEIIGYFDFYGNADLPFDAQNPYLRYRMNIWSNATGAIPKDTNNFTGDVFSSDATPGAFTFSDTGARRISSKPQDAPSPIYRLSYRLDTPLVLEAGEYWFSHDASVRAQPAAASTAQSVTVTELKQMITSRQTENRKPALHFSLAGRDFSIDNWDSMTPVVVRPSAPVEY
jgi:uncharacterized protein (TIGR03437 family)